MKRFVIFFIGLIMIQYSLAQIKESSIENRKQVLTEWKILSSTQTTQEGNVISSSGVKVANWINCKVPTTVLGALVNAGIYPDPHFGLNNIKIPDASDTLSNRLNLSKYSHLKGIPNPFKDPYWFRTTFSISKKNEGRRVWLNFDGINYRADVWVNGKQVANSTKMAGMFRRFKYDVTKYINLSKENVVAVKIHQVDHVGTPNPGYLFEPFGPPRGQGDGIFKDVTLKMSAGWDCAPVVRDRNMGIYQDVYLSFTDGVKILDPYIVTDLQFPDTTKADITITTELKNFGNSSIKGVLKGSIDLINEIDFYSYKKKLPGKFETVTFEKKIEILAGKTIEVVFSPYDFTQLNINNPYLWWPNGYGEQYLHNLNLKFEANKKVSDEKNIMFGIRKITSTLKEINGEFGRIFWVNGKRIFSQGGFIQPDMMLNMNKKRMYDEARLLHNANVNMIANEDMPSPPAHVMETYDKYGLMMWEVFFQCWTSYPGTSLFENPIDTKLALENMYDVVKRYRNHPSLALWCMQIETIIRKELYVPLRKFIQENDPSRPFIATSSHGWDVDKLTPYITPDLPTGMTDEAEPDYTWYPHKYYYQKVLEVKDQMFRNEMGVPAISTYESMKKYIPNLGGGKKGRNYPLDSAWAFHDAWDTLPNINYAFKPYDRAIRMQFGEPNSAKEYIRWAQYINAGSYRAMFEAYRHRMWKITTGVMIWKLNATWPQVLWQIYDWFLNPNAGYYYAKKALEPVHIQMNENDKMVSVINATHELRSGLKAEIIVYDFDLKEKWRTVEKFTIGGDQYKDLIRIPQQKEITPVYFIQLVLKDENENIISDNFYWISKDGKDNFKELTALPNISLDINSTISYNENDIILKIHVKNNSNHLAFMKRLKITKGKNGSEVLPTFWSDNFLTLLPKEDKIITATFSKQDLDGNQPELMVDDDQ